MSSDLDRNFENQCQCQQGALFLKGENSSLGWKKSLAVFFYRMGYELSEKKNQQLTEQVKVLGSELLLAHAHIHNLQDAYNDCRDWFSNVEFEPETDELDEHISLDYCDEREATSLKTSTEEFAMGWFRYWYAHIKETYRLKDLNDYINWSDRNLDKLSERIREVSKSDTKEVF